MEFYFNQIQIVLKETFSQIVLPIITYEILVYTKPNCYRMTVLDNISRVPLKQILKQPLPPTVELFSKLNDSS